ncbi:protein of unknown function (plasmid) [Cupriavidus taiwanensis]|uniref:Uncharacterized protein n=1 Tax=Cupriavidus taiwanensis TaxID=164546 RepID=A0A7Z7NNS5_9BURK|nr:protein of unknown function [Cupriavidus taiwanensis]SOZ13119.1 protein of unknown function [Cupriavidus taiwanensis]SOZ41681.1 protein of unknown function [Cupriavidus taiwanensis]SPC21027.1 protein of unknown function [Cupriavidus taiwanensis]SPD55169.1 protein of unknown function [Cupriavidus taiwanensis]
MDDREDGPQDACQAARREAGPRDGRRVAR